MTPTDFVAIMALGMLIFGWACLGFLILWMVWDMVFAPLWNWAALRWRAWRGRDDDDQWRA